MNEQQELPEIEPGQTFASEVWNTLSRVDVADHIETAEVKNKEGRAMYTYQYLGWAWCWSILMKHYPDSEFNVLDEDFHSDGSVMVNVMISVKADKRQVNRSMYLPVMDPRNNSQINPTSRHISDTRMRCLVKCLAFKFGLGLDLWTGSDYPVGVEDDFINPEQVELLSGMFGRLSNDSQTAFLGWMEVDSIHEIPVLKYKSARTQLERKVKKESE
jgi:hypothetical protein